MSRRSICPSINLCRKATRVPLTPQRLLGIQAIQDQLPQPVHHGRGLSRASSETPVYASRMSAKARIAGETGGCPRCAGRYRLANSRLGRLHQTVRGEESRKNTNSGSRMVEWFQTRVSRLTCTTAVWYGRSMNAVYLRGEIKTPGWMIHRNRNRNTSTFAA